MWELFDVLFLVCLLSAAYSIRGGWDETPLPNWGLQIAGRLGVWGMGLFCAYVEHFSEAADIKIAVMLAISGFGMMFIPHSFVMTAGTTKLAPHIVKPSLEQHWPTAWWPWHPNQAQWDAMSWPHKCWHHTWQTSFVMLLRSGVAFIPYVMLGGDARGALQAAAIITALCPIANVIAFRVIPKNQPWTWAMHAMELMQGAVWGLAFSRL